jgi:hypothetical protein
MRSILGLRRQLFFDKWFAYAQGGLCAVRRLLREIPTCFRAPRQKKRRPVQPSMEALELRMVPSTQASAVLEANQALYPPLVPLGETNVDLNLGGVRLSQPLDFDESPGTSVGGDPALVYNGSTVGVIKPIIQVTVIPDLGLTLNQIKVRLTWDNATQSWVTFGTYSASATEIVAVQDANAVTQTGRYDWKVDVEVDYSGGVTWTSTYSGRDTVVLLPEILADMAA